MSAMEILAASAYSQGKWVTFIICMVTLVILLIWLLWPRKVHSKEVDIRVRYGVQAPAWRIVDAPPPPPPVFDQEDPTTWPQNLGVR